MLVLSESTAQRKRFDCINWLNNCARVCVCLSHACVLACVPACVCLCVTTITKVLRQVLDFLFPNIYEIKTQHNAVEYTEAE